MRAKKKHKGPVIYLAARASLASPSQAQKNGLIGSSPVHPACIKTWQPSPALSSEKAWVQGRVRSRSGPENRAKQPREDKLWPGRRSTEYTSTYSVYVIWRLALQLNWHPTVVHADTGSQLDRTSTDQGGNWFFLQRVFRISNRKGNP